MGDFDNDDNDDNANKFGGGELVMQRGGDGNFIGGGYSINSTLLRNGAPAIYTTPHNITDPYNNVLADEHVFKQFDNFVIPAGLFYINQKMPQCTHDEKYTEHTALSDDIHDALFALMSINKPTQRQKHTKKQKYNLNAHIKKTKKYKM